MTKATNYTKCNVQYGCMCVGTCYVHSKQHQNRNPEKAPILYEVERKGNIIKVCSRCNLKSDNYLKIFEITKEHYDYDDELQEESIAISPNELRGVTT